LPILTSRGSEGWSLLKDSKIRIKEEGGAALGNFKGFSQDRGR
jgi:hypothetical protein